jgi:hypothetical protein
MLTLGDRTNGMPQDKQLIANQLHGDSFIDVGVISTRGGCKYEIKRLHNK